MMKNLRIIRAGLLFLLLGLSGSSVVAQIENVPVRNPVYRFLERMETRGVLGRYFDAVKPLARRDVAMFLEEVKQHEQALSGTEREFLEDFRREFRFDIDRTDETYRSTISPPDSQPFSIGGSVFGPEEKYLFAASDSSHSLFVNGLLTMDARGISGDALGTGDAQYLQFGGRFRGTLFNHLGYYLEGTNAQFWGSRELLQRDPIISQSHTIYVTDTRNFDFAEGYVKYGGEIASVQVGRERLLWGTGFDQAMIASENVRVYDFIRAQARYEWFQYTFLHAWLLGERSSLQFTVQGDTTIYTEPTNADKYFAAHRFEVSFPGVIDVGFQEMVIYSNRSPDLAYLNPLIVIESAQRSRGERDNVYWAFDFETRFLAGLQLNGTILFDDLHLDEFFAPRWYNRYAYQGGIALSDPLFLPNLYLNVEYTRVEPFVFSHNRSRESTYSSLGSVLGPRIGPNAESWALRLDWLPVNRLLLSATITLERSGENVYDTAGNLVKNVGGDHRQPHRPTDPVDRVFLDGNRVNGTVVQGYISWEAVHQLWIEGGYLLEDWDRIDQGTYERNHTWELKAKLEF
ncbi:MAG: capsule assembly Wzi family protein [Ignavibacteria bacterium]|nr:capsule assembly Wzi family protein [Ignavibacteria bacterium]